MLPAARWEALSAGQPAAHAVLAAAPATCRAELTRHCLFGMPCPGGRAGRAGRMARVPCHGHSPSHPRALLRSPSPGSGSSARQPSRSAAWPCPWSSRPGTERGTGVAPRHRTGAGSCLSLPRGSPEALPPLPVDSQLQNTDAFSAGGAGSLSRCSPYPSWHGRVQLWGGSRRQSRDPRAASRQSGAQPPAPSVSGAAGGPSHRYVLAVPIPGVAVWPPGRDGHGEVHGRKLREGKRCGCGSQGQMQRHSPIPGGLPAARPSRMHPLPSCAHPCSVQCPKEAKETRGGRDGGGERWRPPVQAVFLWVQEVRGPSLPCSPPSAHRCPASALLVEGGCNTVLAPQTDCELPK